MPRKQKQYHFIYKTTCVVTGKFYVGMHSTDDLNDGYLGSGKILGYSIRKHGRENHKLEILEMCGSRELLKVREKEIVNEALLADPLNINLKYGGEGGGKFWSEEQRKNATIAGNRSPARNHEEISKRIVETKRLRGTLNRKQWGNWLGRKSTDEHRAKQRATFAEIGHMQGEKNSQFGTCWVTNGVSPIKIKKERLEEYLSNGYSRGRKCG